MQNPAPSSQTRRHLSPDDLAWLGQNAAQARREWSRLRRHGSAAEKAQALDFLSGIVCDLEGPAVALRLSRRANRLWKTVGDPESAAVSGAVLAVRLLDAGRPREALRQSTLAREAMLSLGRASCPAPVMVCLGKAFLAGGHGAEAQAWLDAALETLVGDERAEALALLSRVLDWPVKVPAGSGR